jgi:20S proteasome subunit alpha 4
VGRNSKTVREYLENNYSAESVASEEQAVKLAVKALMEVVESSKNIEIAVVRNKQAVEFVKEEDLEQVVQTIEREKAEAEQHQTGGAGSTSQ